MSRAFASIPLTAWAERRYPEGTPSIHTLRRWVREQKILPKPTKVGRAYFVPENAVYINYNDPESVKAASESTSTQ